MPRKLTNEQLIQSFWEATLRQLPEKTLLENNGKISLIKNDTARHKFSVSIGIQDLDVITSEIVKPQLRIRIRKLRDQGIFEDSTLCNKRFHLEIPESSRAFNGCLYWWKVNGVSETPQPKPNNLNKLKQQCSDYLFRRFSHIDLQKILAKRDLK